MSVASSTKGRITALEKAVEKIKSDFNVNENKISLLTNEFLKSMELGLQHQARGEIDCLPMIPTYVTGVPTGDETGVYLAADLGGTNFRVCAVDLKGGSLFELIDQEKNRVPDDLLTGTSNELFSYLAKKIKKYVNSLKQTPGLSGRYKLGFTFSYPVDQSALDRGTLIRWTKGFNVKDALGEDVVHLLQFHLNSLRAPVDVVALSNDTTGTLLSHAYGTGATPNGNQGESAIGAIFGTGTNGCYLEPIENIGKLDEQIAAELKSQGKDKLIINTEWGSFDNQLKFLPNTVYDERVDAVSTNPGFHMFEKRISGLYLGEILRQILVDLHGKGLIFKKYSGSSVRKLPYKLRKSFALESELLSHVEIDDSSNLRDTQLYFNQGLHVDTTFAERQAIQQIVRAISRRSAFLSAVPLAAILIRTGALEGYNKEVEVGVDGSVVEYYPGFRAMMREALALSPVGPAGERKVHIRIAKDGSGVGAALCAATTD